MYLAYKIWFDVETIKNSALKFILQRFFYKLLLSNAMYYVKDIATWITQVMRYVKDIATWLTQVMRYVRDIVEDLHLFGILSYHN